MRLARGVAARGLLWFVLALPALWIAWRWAVTPALYGFGHAIKDSGDWAGWLLLATLAITPLCLVVGTRPFTRWLQLRRRDLGVASFVYAAGHTVIYLSDRTSWREIVAEGTAAELLTGWIALALFVPLAVTSNDAAVRALKRKWKELHRLVYPAAILVFLHWSLTAFDPTTAYVHIAILAGIEAVRIALQFRRRSRQSVV